MSAAPLSLFISHSSLDKTFVNRLVARLREAGVDGIWYDAYDVGPATDDLHRQIKEGIAAAGYFALVLSPRAELSQWVSYEIQQALAASKPVLAVLIDAPRGVRDFLDNPHVSDLLRGGHQKVINFTADFDRALNDVLLVIAPAEGERRIVAQTVNEILTHDDPDVAERFMTTAALRPEAYLPPLLSLVPELRNDAKWRYRVAHCLTFFGASALPGLFDLLMRRADVQSATIPAEIPHEVDPETGETSYTGDAFTDLLRHVIVTGGNRAWAAQVAAQRCLLAIADADADLRLTIHQNLTATLRGALQDIQTNRHLAAVNEVGFDVLRLTIETLGLLKRVPLAVDPWLIHQFVDTQLWGRNESANAKYKLGSYVVECLSRIGTRQAMDGLLKMSTDSEIREQFFEGHRAPNPWHGCFVGFGNMAVDVLLQRLKESDELFRNVALQNLSRIANPRGLAAVLDEVEAPEWSDDFERIDLLMLASQHQIPETATRIVHGFGAGLLPEGRDEYDRGHVEQAVALAVRGVPDRALATQVCTALTGTSDAHAQWNLVEAIAAHRVHSLYEFLRTAFTDASSPAVRGGAAIALSKVKDIDADVIARRLATAEEEVERPYLSIALAWLDDARAIPGLIDGMKRRFLDGDTREHEICAEALGRLSDPSAAQLRTKYYKRI